MAPSSAAASAPSRRASRRCCERRGWPCRRAQGCVPAYHGAHCAAALFSSAKPARAPRRPVRGLVRQRLDSGECAILPSCQPRLERRPYLAPPRLFPRRSAKQSETCSALRYGCTLQAACRMLEPTLRPSPNLSLSLLQPSWLICCDTKISDRCVSLSFEPVYDLFR